MAPNTLWVLFGTALLGIAGGVLGCFAFLRGRSLMGDALAHAALPGVCAAFLLAEGGNAAGLWKLDPKSLLLLLTGAALSGVIAAWFISGVARWSRLKEDASQAIVLSVFFGAGIVLLTRIQHGGSGEQSGLDKWLFGQAASLVGSDVKVLAWSALGLCVLSWALFKEWKLLCFDRAFAHAIGLRSGILDSMLLGAIVLAVVIGLQAVGVVLIAALLVTPPAAARFWTDKLERMVALSACFGALSGVCGTYLSTLLPRLPTGPLIVLSATLIFLISMFFAPRRGALSRAWKQLSTRRQVKIENRLRDLWELQHRDEAATSESLLLKRREPARGLESTLQVLARRGWVAKDAATSAAWRLTTEGETQARQIVRRHRLWEAFLMLESQLGQSRVHRDADAAEHFLPPEVVSQLETLMKQHNIAVPEA